jgi:hypothetical protein
MRVIVEGLDQQKCDRKLVEENFLKAFFKSIMFVFYLAQLGVFSSES